VASSDAQQEQQEHAVGLGEVERASRAIASSVKASATDDLVLNHHVDVSTSPRDLLDLTDAVGDADPLSAR
jgi:hypothetical protein